MKVCLLFFPANMANFKHYTRHKTQPDAEEYLYDKAKFYKCDLNGLPALQ